MRKILFNDRYRLTESVLNGTKTMFRRAVGNRMTKDDIAAYLKGYKDVAYNLAPYKIGEVVAVGQCYRELYEKKEMFFQSKASWESYKSLAGWNNKMFVRADLMPHQIRITDVKVECLQDISDEDIIKEGVEKGMYLEPENVLYYFDEFCGFFRDGQVRIKGYSYKTAREAFAALIDKVSGKGTWESNPYVFAYEFELVK